MAQTTGTFAALYDNVDKTVYTGLGEYLTELKPIWRQYYNVMNSDRRFERVTGTIGMGDVPEKPEGQPYTLDLIRQGFTKDFLHTEFGMGFAVTETALEDDQFDALDKATMWLAYSARVVQEKRAAIPFNNGFTSETTWDGVSVFSTAHPLQTGASGQNTLTTAADLSATSLTQALIDLQNLTRLESGQIVAPISDLVLLVPPDLEFMGDRLLNSVGLPQSADNDRNPIKARRSWTMVVNPHLTDNDAWFLLAANKKMHGCRSYTRVPITQVPPMTDPNTGNRLYKVRFRQSWGFAYWQSSYGSPGA